MDVQWNSNTNRWELQQEQDVFTFCFLALITCAWKVLDHGHGTHGTPLEPLERFESTARTLYVGNMDGTTASQ